MDQLSRLRHLEAYRARGGAHFSKKKGADLQCWAIGAGKGGAGKSVIAGILALELANAGKRVLLLDCSYHLPQLPHLFGIAPGASLETIFDAQASLVNEASRITEQLYLYVPTYVAPGASDYELMFFDRVAAAAQGRFDYLICDLPGGFGVQHRGVCKLAQRLTMVVTPGHDAIAGNYAFIKLARQTNPALAIEILMNRTTTEEEARLGFENLGRVCEHFLRFRPVSLGWLQIDPDLERLQKSGRPVSQWPADLAIRAQLRRIVHAETGADQAARAVRMAVSG